MTTYTKETEENTNENDSQEYKKESKQLVTSDEGAGEIPKNSPYIP